MQLLPISQLANKLGLNAAFIPYGHYVGKIDHRFFNNINKKEANLKDLDKKQLGKKESHKEETKKGKLILVTAITPTPFGEGKTVTTIGLSEALNYIGKTSIACIRQPSLGPVFGIKGGAAGGGLAEVVPTDLLNLHLTGDIHAITAAHDLAAAAIDARLFHETRLGDQFTAKTQLPRLNIDKDQIVWQRALDMNDRTLRAIQLDPSSEQRASSFEITAASELMAILALSTDLFDMRSRIGQIILAYNQNGDSITAEQLEVAGAMTALLKEAINPNIMQTTEQTPAFIHAGPFANIAHGNSSIIADEIALSLCDYVVTEAGFGSDMGMEKFFNIKYRASKTAPSCIVLVATVRSLKANSGLAKPTQEMMMQPNLELLKVGSANLKWHIQNAKSYGLPVIVAINRFLTDSKEELDYLQKFALKEGAFACEISELFTQGGKGGELLAKQIVLACDRKSNVQLPYQSTDSIKQKIEILARKYGASQVIYSQKAEQSICKIEQLHLDHFPICIAKTPLSISSDPKLKNVPEGFVMQISDVAVSAGARFIRVYAGDIMTMPGLNALPAYRQIDIDQNGDIIGLK